MADFTPITINSQDELNKMFGERAETARRAEQARMEQKYSGFDDYKAKAEKYDADISELEKKITGLEDEKTSNLAKITELETKIREYESNSVKMRIAREAGLPVEFAERLSGADEKALREDAEKLGKLIKHQTGTAPLFKPSDDPNAGKDAALKNLLASIKNQGG